MRLNRKELRKIQYDFNSIASRLLQADFQDYTGVLGKFLNYIDSTPIIIDYVIADDFRPGEDIIASRFVIWGINNNWVAD